MILQFLGFLFVLVVPGFLLTMIFFKDEPLLEKIALVVLMSIGFTTALGVILGFNEFTYRITGGLSRMNVWVYSAAANALLLGYYLYQNRGGKKSRKRKSRHLYK